MRIVAGTWRSRTLLAPRGAATRPTTDRLRETIFDVLDGVVTWENTTVLDCFAGSGALGLEALSRGAVHATFVERDRRALFALRANIDALGCAARATVVPRDAVRMACAGDLAAEVVFADPPYALAETPRFVTCVFARSIFRRIFVLETSARARLAFPVAPWKERRAGETRITMFNRADGVISVEPAR